MAGFRAVRRMGEGEATGNLETYSVVAAHASILAPGDVVKLTGAYDNTNHMPEADAAAAGDLVLGVIESVDHQIGSPENRHLPASTAGFIKVRVGKGILYSATTSTTLTIEDVGNNADIVATAATLTGNLAFSNMTIDTSTTGTATSQFRIHGIGDDVDVSGSTIAAGSEIFVTVNESQLDGTVGV